MKTLLAITTYNQSLYTKKAEQSIPDIEGMDIVFVDDASTDDTIQYLESKNRTIIQKKEGRGLTDSWNIAYRKFKDESYDGLIISNNDVLFNYTLQDLVDGLSKHEVVVPLTSRGGSGCSMKRQDVQHYYPSFNKSTNDKLHTEQLKQLNKKEYMIISWMHGFCFGLNRSIIKCEWDEKHLFNPKNVNCHQEADLYPRITGNGFHSRVCLSSFVFHYVSRSLPYKGNINGVDSRNVFEYNRK